MDRCKVKETAAGRERNACTEKKSFAKKWKPFGMKRLRTRKTNLKAKQQQEGLNEKIQSKTTEAIISKPLWVGEKETTIE